MATFDFNKAKSSFNEMTYIKNITRLLDYLNNNYGNLYPILSNHDSISSQEYKLRQIPFSLGKCFKKTAEYFLKFLFLFESLILPVNNGK